MDLIKREQREAKIKAHKGDVYGIVALFDVWRSESTGERKLELLCYSNQMLYMDALDLYANTPNPASKLIKFIDEDDMKEAIAELQEDIKDPKWLFNLFQQI